MILPAFELIEKTYHRRNSSVKFRIGFACFDERVQVSTQEKHFFHSCVSVSVYGIPYTCVCDISQKSCSFRVAYALRP
jgi:hypothetical protein